MSKKNTDIAGILSKIKKYVASGWDPNAVARFIAITWLNKQKYKLNNYTHEMLVTFIEFCILAHLYRYGPNNQKNLPELCAVCNDPLIKAVKTFHASDRLQGCAFDLKDYCHAALDELIWSIPNRSPVQSAKIMIDIWKEFFNVKVPDNLASHLYTLTVLGILSFVELHEPDAFSIFTRKYSIPVNCVQEMNELSTLWTTLV